MTSLKSADNKKAPEFAKFFNFKKLADVTKIHPDKIYNNFKGFYHSLDETDKTSIAKALKPRVEELFKFLGYSIKIEKEKAA
jgi:hypothetical protein